jgi:hypothetical protein
MRPFGGQSTRDPHLEVFLERNWDAPACARPFKYHRDYESSSWLDDSPPSNRHSLPLQTYLLIKGLIHHYRRRKSGFAAGAKRAFNAVANIVEDRAATAFFEGWGGVPRGEIADWFSLIIWEPKRIPAIQYREQSDRHALWIRSIDKEARQTRFYCDVPIQVALYVGRNPIVPVYPPDLWSSRIKGRLQYSQFLSQERNAHRWFKIGCYVPDALALPSMNPSAFQRYTEIKKWYHQLHWYERGKELVQGTVPAALKLGVKVATGALSAMSADAEVLRGSPMAVRRMENQSAAGRRGDADPAFDHLQRLWYGNTTAFNRKNLPPPGYVFVKFNCMLEVFVIGVGW